MNNVTKTSLKLAGPRLVRRYEVSTYNGKRHTILIRKTFDEADTFCSVVKGFAKKFGIKSLKKSKATFYQEDNVMKIFVPQTGTIHKTCLKIEFDNF